MDSSLKSDAAINPDKKPTPNTLPEGLSQVEAEKRLMEFGPNALPEQKTRLWLVFIKKLWAPIPWMLEVSVILELVLGKFIEAGVIGALVLFNAVMSTFQENRAQNALALLKNV